MKFALVIILIAVIMLIASNISTQYKDKFNFYNQLKCFFQQFKLNVSFKQEKLETFLTNFKAEKQFKTFVTNYQNYLKGEEFNLSSIKILDNIEQQEIVDIVKTIGNYNTKREIEQLDLYIETANLRLNKAKEAKQRICPMIIKLSLLFALALAILLI